MNENTNDVFEKYYEYLAPIEIIGNEDNKQKLMKQFENFLNNPMEYGGYFVIRWKENDSFENNVDFSKFLSHIK